MYANVSSSSARAFSDAKSASGRKDERRRRRASHVRFEAASGVNDAAKEGDFGFGD